MKRNRPHTPVILEPVEQRTFFSFTAAPISASISTEITASLGYTAQITEHEVFPGAMPGFIQMPFMHQLHGPFDQTSTPPTETATPDTGTANTGATDIGTPDTGSTDSTTTVSSSVATDSKPVTQSIAVNASLSQTAITDASPLTATGSDSFVTDWAIATETAPTTTSQQSSIVTDAQQPTLSGGKFDFFAAATAQPQQDDSTDFQALLTYLRQTKKEAPATGMFSPERIPALQEISAGTHSPLPSFQHAGLPLALSRPTPAASSPQPSLAQSPSQTLLESLSPNGWLLAGSLLVLAAQQFSHKHRTEDNPKNQFQFLSPAWQPEPLDPKE